MRTVRCTPRVRVGLRVSPRELGSRRGSHDRVNDNWQRRLRAAACARSYAGGITQRRAIVLRRQAALGRPSLPANTGLRTKRACLPAFPSGACAFARAPDARRGRPYTASSVRAIYARNWITVRRRSVLPNRDAGSVRPVCRPAYDVLMRGRRILPSTTDAPGDDPLPAATAAHALMPQGVSIRVRRGMPKRGQGRCTGVRARRKRQAGCPSARARCLSRAAFARCMSRVARGPYVSEVLSLGERGLR